MSYNLFNFSRKGAAKGKSLREQAAELLQVKMWGIGEDEDVPFVVELRDGGPGVTVRRWRG